MTARRTFAAAVAALFVLSAPAPSTDFFAQADCSNTSAFVSIDLPGANHCAGIASADGSYSVTNADGAEITYSIEGTEYQRETKSESSGSWDFTDNFSPSPGWYTFTAKACPRVWNGSGHTVCLQHCYTASDDFQAGILDTQVSTCSWDCDFMGGDCTGTCDAVVENCDGPYDHTWCVDDGINLVCENTQTSSSTSFTSPLLECEMGDPIHLDVENDSGEVGSASWNCGFE